MTSPQTSRHVGFSANSFLAVVLSYTTIIFSVMYFSGRTTERSMFDRYTAELRGAKFPVTDLDRAARFYTEVLGLQQKHYREDDRTDSQEFLLPGNIPLMLHSEKLESGGHSTLFVRVKNGFTRLQSGLLKKSKKPAVRAPKLNSPESRATLSEIFSVGNYRTFVAVDPDGNRIAFFEGGTKGELPPLE